MKVVVVIISGNSILVDYFNSARFDLVYPFQEEQQRKAALLASGFLMACD